MPQTPELEQTLPAPPVTIPLPGVGGVPKRRLSRLGSLFPGGQFARYLVVGVFNTGFGYITFAIAFTLLGHHIAPHLLYLAAPLASIVSTPLNITVAYFNYKFFVFKTRGNYLREWLKCFAVYGIGMIPGLVALGALTRLLQGVLARHAAGLRGLLLHVESPLHGTLLATVQHAAHARIIAGYLAGAIVIGFSTIYSFLGHKKVTFKDSSGATGEKSGPLENRRID